MGSPPARNNVCSAAWSVAIALLALPGCGTGINPGDVDTRLFGPCGDNRLVYSSRTDLSGAWDGSASTSANLWTALVPASSAPSAMTRISGGGGQDSQQAVMAQDGSFFVFSSKLSLVGIPTQPALSFNIWRMSWDGGTSQALTQSAGAGLDSSEPVVSTDGSAIALTSKMQINGSTASSTNIWIMKADGTGLMALTQNTVAGLDSNQPAFSPDGGKIVFTSKMNVGGVASSTNIWIMNADGSNPTAVTQNTNASLDSDTPAFSPDGQWIVFQSHMKWSALPPGWNAVPDGSAYNIWRVKTDETSFAPLTRESGSADSNTPTYYFDGSRILFSSKMNISGGASSSYNVWVMNADGTSPTPLTRTTSAGNDSVNPVFSLDGRRIAFQSKLAPAGSSSPALSDNIWTMNFDGSSPAALTANTIGSRDSALRPGAFGLLRHDCNQ